MHRLFKLQHRRHTGRLLPHHHTSYRALALLLLFVGTLLLSFDRLQHRTAAQDIFVNATVPAELPTEAAVITKPSDNSSTYDQTILMEGTCEIAVPTIGIAIYRNGELVASAPCAGDGTFAITVPLAVGGNTLIVRSVNITGGYGPDSQPVHITRLQSPTSTNPTGTGGSGTTTNVGSRGTPKTSATQKQASQTTPIEIRADNPYTVFSPQKQAEWTGTISGGRAPYTIKISWGDRQVDIYKHQASGHHAFAHQYTVMAPHVLRITVTDAAGNSTSAPFAALTSFVGPTYSTIYGGRIGGVTEDQLMASLYLLFILSICTVLLFWLHTHRRIPIVAKRRQTRKTTTRRRT